MPDQPLFNDKPVAVVHSTPPPMTPDSRGAVPPVISWLESALFFCFMLFALCAPLATKGAVTSYRAALVIWLVKILVEKGKLHRQPLALPLLLFLLLTGISTVFSMEPLLSWGRMRGVTELTIAILVGQSIRNLRQLKILVSLLLLASLVSVGITAWQYTFGIGVQLPGDSVTNVFLSRLGFLPGDIIQKVNRRKVYTPQQLLDRLDHLPPNASVELTVVRPAPITGAPTTHLNVIDQKKILEQTLKKSVPMTRGRPQRAQGTFKHYFPYSEVMVLIGLVAWGLFIAPGTPDVRLKILLGFCFLSIAVVVVLTLTRISLVSLLLGCFLVTWRDVGRRARELFSVAFLGILLLSVNWVQQHRSQKWLDLSDPGNQYRLLMWRDSVKYIRAHPLLGVGLDSITGHWQRWDLEAYRRFPLKSHFHSTPIQIAVECGIPALLVWFWLMGGYLNFLLRLSTVSRNQGWFSHGLASGILGGLVAVLLTALLQYNFGDAEAMVVFWFLMGIAFALERILREGGAKIARVA